jgi:hypothetical protein
LAEARQLLGVNPQQAIIRYQQVRELDPNNAEALTYMGWLIAQSGTSTAAAGAEFLRGAIKIDPTYADPHCFPGDHFRRLPAAARPRTRRAARRKPVSTTTLPRRWCNSVKASSAGSTRTPLRLRPDHYPHRG